MTAGMVPMTEAPITGRCYCGAKTVRAERAPLAVAYCHCSDCRRVTGAPVTVWAAFADGAVTFTPDEGCVAAPNPGVTRTFCGSCGSTLASRYDYLPGQVYLPVGLLDQAGEIQPDLHAHASQGLPWLKIDDSLERFTGSSRTRLNRAGSNAAGMSAADVLERTKP